MQISVLKAKLHQAMVTHTELNYDGSCAIDASLLEAAGINEYEQIDIYNIDNGERFTTYALKAPPDSKIISLNGAAARKASAGDRIIICSYAQIEAQDIYQHQPRLCYLDEQNNLKPHSNLRSIPDYEKPI